MDPYRAIVCVGRIDTSHKGDVEIISMLTNTGNGDDKTKEEFENDRKNQAKEDEQGRKEKR